MTYVRDVWVNWFEGEENGYNVCPFYEWRRDDRIEILDEVVVIATCEQLFQLIENDLQELPETLLQFVHKQSYLRRSMSRIQLDYCFIASDGKRVIAVDTAGYKTPIRKSRVTPKKEQEILNLVTEGQLETFTIRKKRSFKEYHLLSPDPEQLLGLTRKERQLKQLLYMALDHLFSTGSEAEIRYWYTEWNPESYVDIQTLSRKTACAALFKEIKDGWTLKHMQFCEALVKGNEYFEKLWELERGESVK